MRFQRAAKLAPSSSGMTADDRLEYLLLDWGDQVRKWNPAARLGIRPISPVFRDAQCGIDWSLDAYESVDVERMRLVNAAVDDLRAPSLSEWLCIHWHYAAAQHRTNLENRTVPAVWRNNRLPPYGSDDYLVLLVRARGRVRDGILRRRHGRCYLE